MSNKEKFINHIEQLENELKAKKLELEKLTYQAFENKEFKRLKKQIMNEIKPIKAEIKEYKKELKRLNKALG